jgi:hypothetical protein
MHTSKTWAYLAITVLTLGACKKDSEAPVENTPNTSPANVSLDFRFMKGLNPFTLDSTVTDSLGHAVKLTTFKFYASGIHAEDDYEQHIGEWPAAYLLIDASQPMNIFPLGTMAAAHLHQFHCNLGLEDSTNLADPSLSDAPLNDTTMYWPTNTALGHRFVRIEGRVDANGDGFDVNDPIFRYDCYTSASLSEAHAHEHHDVAAGENYVAPVLIDMAQLFAGISVADTLSAMGATPTNLRFISNLSGAIDGME